jgi:lipid-A-disaccharide synthase
MPSLLIIAGENSGEKYGADLVRQFKQTHPDFSFFGIGGSHMQAEGVELLFTIKDLSLVGIFEIISHLSRLRQILKQVLKEAIRRRPLAAVLIDCPDFNLRLARSLKKVSIPVLYYISPTIWAWRIRRIKTIKSLVKKMLLIFPFEEKIYQEHNMPAVYIGHPLKERIKIDLSEDDFFKKFNLDKDRQLITILPGSRKSEIDFHVPVLKKAVFEIKKKYPKVQFLIVCAENLQREDFDKFKLEEISDLALIAENRYEAMAYSKLLLASCGTSNLEAALLGTPVISFYRLSPLTYFFGSKFVKIKIYSIVNILAGKKLIPELIQNKFTPENISAEVSSILDSSQLRDEIKTNFLSLDKVLGDKKASKNAALELSRLVGKDRSE